MARSLKPKRPPFELDGWYSSEGAKRRLGSICTAVNREGASVGVMGSEDQPYLFLSDVDGEENDSSQVEISIDAAKAEWSAVTAAAIFYGTSFRLVGKKVPRAVLSRNSERDHPALKYRQPESPRTGKLVATLEEVIRELKTI